MKKENIIKKNLEIIDKLNELLATYAVFHQNAFGYHWNIKGSDFFELHEKFEALYKNIYKKIDTIAERILSLGGTPKHNFSDNLALSKIKESKDITDGSTSVSEILDSYTIILELQNNIFKLSERAKDIGTTTLLSEYILEQEKEVWKYASFQFK